MRIWRIAFCLFLTAGTVIGQSATQGAPAPPQAPTQGAPAQTAPASSAPAQTAPTQTTSAQAPAPIAGKPAASEISSRDEVATFKVKVNLVLVRVVVRDGQGHAVGNLRKEDFQLLDNRKPQVISHFAMEQPGAYPAAAPAKATGAEEGSSSIPPMMPERYVAYLFDDVHLEFGDLARARDAADRHMATLNPNDRAAVFTTSGQGNLDFTDDRALLQEAMRKLQPRPVARLGTRTCPDVTYYMADLIQNKHDSQALQVATADALNCQYNNDPRFLNAAGQLAASTAMQQLNLGEAESHLTLTVFKDVIRRMTTMPGQRTVLLISPGFLTPQMESDYTDLIDRALHEQIIISALNARGLYTVAPGGDISLGGQTTVAVMGYQSQYAVDSARAEEDVLSILADGTGGAYYHNSNDLDTGFKRIATAPEYFYMLGFSPQNLKLDGRFHSLKVTVKEPPKLAIQARRGYYAPSHATDPAEEAKLEIEDALFSQEELHDLPIQLHTQFFKASDADAKLAVLVHVDVKDLHFRKEEGRNRNDLTIVSGLFDRNGRYIMGNQKVLEMRLKDETLANKVGPGITIKTSFDVKPGSYLVRLVVRDAEGQLAATNGAIEIP